MRPPIRLARRGPNATPLPYTASPLRLLERDLCLCLRYAWALPLLFIPLRLGQTTSLDELHPNLQSSKSFGVQVLLTLYQLFFLISLPLLVICMLPTSGIIVYIAGALAINYTICMFILNGWDRVVVSQVPTPEQPAQARECWFFINGVAASHHWLQNSVNQLSYTFGRKVTGIHNRTCGLIFDLLECLIQRCFSYATDDVRKTYVLIKDALLDPDCDKVVLILHSQGAIEGGLIVDWLLDELPRDPLNNLEVYTFGNAANHFNNPLHWQQAVLTPSGASTNHESILRSLGHIEHYVNVGDPVAWLGVLHFVEFPNCYMGRLFVRPGSGHMMNQHYLDNMFTRGFDGRVLDSNPFMDMEVELDPDGSTNGTSGTSGSMCEETLLPTRDPRRAVPNGSPKEGVLRVKDFSRLWQYRNGGSPRRLKNE
ncbi:hypothetical protein N7492_007483 [Penicillium capsulatum]|uniref:Uncharacterized protein n=1 Tax=Penicillium capsulatum TaxID=69766 RepID=A0A9W9LM43_9EURO|nr:hypothetical protein N7492_007483 [Penicillium capsulatum]KAJ6117316.1 hypothetical protein N7512_007041 [Penicillium capsulatum]